MELATAIVGSTAIFSGVIGGTITLIKFMGRKNSIRNPGECTDADCKASNAKTAITAARNTQDIDEIKVTINDRLVPKIDKTHDATLRMMTKLDMAIKVNGEREDSFKKMINDTVTTSVEKILGFKAKDEKEPVT